MFIVLVLIWTASFCSAHLKQLQSEKEVTKEKGCCFKATQNVRLSPWPFSFNKILLQLSIPKTKHASTALVYTDQDQHCHQEMRHLYSHLACGQNYTGIMQELETQISQDYWICILQYSQAIQQHNLHNNLAQRILRFSLNI